MEEVRIEDYGLEKNAITIAGLGQKAALGDFYDVRTNTFSPSSMFKSEIPNNTISLVEINSSEIKLIENNSYNEKFDKMDIESELKLSILADLISLEGSALFLNEEMSLSTALNKSLLYTIRTVDETVSFDHESIKDYIDIDSLLSGEATHVVIGISWGANSILSCEYHSSNINDIEGNVSAHLENLSSSISNEHNENADYNIVGNIPVNIRLFRDIDPENEDLPTTIEAGLNAMKEMPQLVKITNDGKGKPIQYRLLPIPVLQVHLQLSTQMTLNVTSITETTILRIVKLFQQLSQTKQRINDFQKTVQAYKFCVSPEDYDKIDSLKQSLKTSESELKSKVGTTLSSVRSGVAPESDLKSIIDWHTREDYSPEKIFADLLEKLEFAKTLMDMGVQYIGFENSQLDFQTNAVALYFKEDTRREEPDKIQNNLKMLHQEIEKELGYEFFAVDCDIHPQLWPESGMSVQILQNREDLSKHPETSENIPLAKSTLAFDKVKIPKPSKTKILDIPCTGNTCNPTATYTWSCGNCKENIEYGFDSYFYCNCGRALATTYEFKCPDSLHGSEFQAHEKNYFENLLSMMKPCKQMNILILGETGVGKSTWINGFVNFINFDSLEEAEKNEELCSLIPTEFTVCDEDYNEIIVSTGTDSNEVQDPGKSATQECKVYRFQVGDTIIRLIDTPGVGDTRGVDKDNENFQNILSTLSSLDELHGICILLKPNNARLTVMFRFCIKELLTYLHKDASRNIMFCFTNCRGTFYRPGDTMPALKTLLNEHKDVDIPISSKTIYCFDSEAYRFLAAIKNKDHPINFSADERDYFHKSWEKSITETKRMLNYIASLSPHKIQSTLNLNHARELIIKLTAPMAEIIKESQTIKANIEIHMKNIKETQENIAELEKKAIVYRREIDFKNVQYPRAICTNEECTTYTDELKKPVYNICKERCNGKDSFFGMRRCKAMNWRGNCKICSHNHKYHQHVTFQVEEVVVAVEDDEVKQMLIKDFSAADIKKKMLENCKKEIELYNYELNEIEHASIEFASFLKQNAITPYNDAMLEYMDHLIREEKRKKESTTLEQLEKSRNTYAKGIEAIDKRIQESNVTIPANVDALVQHLYNLKRNGKKLQNALAVVKSAQQNAAVYQEVIASLPLTEKRKMSVFG